MSGQEKESLATPGEMDVEDSESLFDVTSDRCGQLGVHLSTDDEDNEEDGPGQEMFNDEEPALPPDLKWLEELYEEDDGEVDGDGDLAVAAVSGKKRSCDETARMFKLRRNLDQLDCIHRQKEHDVLKASEELKLCQQNIESLMEQRYNLEKEIERQKAADNSVAVFRLRGQHKHLCQKLQSEEELEGHVNTELKQQELELTEVEVELGRFSSLRHEVKEEERVFRVRKNQKAATRLQQERKASQNLQIKMQHLRDKQAAMLKKEEKAKCQKKIAEGQANRKIATKYLKETIKRVHQQEAEKEQQNKELLEKRIQAVKSLKSNIAATQEGLRVHQGRTKANAQKKEQQQRQLRESLQAQGINSFKHMYQQKQLEEIKRQQEDYEERQKSKRVEIVAKILQEEQLVKSRKRHQALQPKPSTTDKFSSLGRAREKLLYSLDPSPPSATEERATVQLRQFSDTSSSSSASSDVEDLEETMHNKVDHQSFTDSLAEPEFSGLWDQNYKKLRNEKTTSVQTEVKQEESVMTSGKLNIPPKKVHGKELKGPPFISKPEVILFKDFEVGKMYKKKIVLTNISYIINHCRLLGVSAHLKDFISINFEPPGSLSPGMSCDMQAVFQPMINEDLEGEVQFASAAGPFSVPVRCTIKKCDLEVDSQFIDFGSHVVGQTISWTITLTNKGALATLFSLDTSTCLSPETSHDQMASQVSANTCQEETSGQNTTCDEQSSSVSMGTGELQPKQESQELSETLQQEHPESEASATGPEAVPETCVSTDVEAQMDLSQSDSGDISLGNVRDGEIGPFESIKLEVVFTPTIPGEAKLDFHIKFSDLTSKPIPVQVRGVAVSVPVWVVQPSIDLKICMFDRLYQDSIMVQNRASSSFKLSFEVCPEMRKHMEVLPKTGFIQAQSSFHAQLKFLPRPSLSKDAKQLFDRDTGVLEVPMTVQVAGQVKPVHFTVQAVVTSSDLQFDRTEVDFGFCSIYQSVKSSVRLTNLSLLPQDFGFLAVPEFIEVQPNDGFGTLLPQETLEIDLIFSANKAKEYNFQLSCKSGINRDFLLSCRAVGVRPPLQLSHSQVQFGATAVGDHSTAILYLINHETNHNQSKPPVPPVAPVAPRLFSFTLPEDSDVSITPSAGRLLPGERCLVQVTFGPRLLDQDIKDEALRLLHRAKLLHEMELEKKRHAEQEKEVPGETSKGRKVPVIPKTRKTSDEPKTRKTSDEPKTRKTSDEPKTRKTSDEPKTRKTSDEPKSWKTSDDPKTDQLTEPPNPSDIQPGSEQYEEAWASLLYSFTQRYSEFTVPCFVSDGDPPEEDRQAQPAWSPFNTLHLKLQCPAVQPPLVVTSNNGHSIIDFHQVAVGEKVIKRFTVQNISKESLDLRSSVLDVRGPFSLLNALRCIRPGEKHTLVLAFSPSLEKRYRETLEVRSQKMSLEMSLCGEGVVPTVTSSHPGGLLDLGYVLEKESTSQVLKLQNSSAVAVGFRVLLASLCPSRPQGGADRVAFLLGSYTDSQVQSTVGTQNYSGMSVFSAVPAEGSIAPGQRQDITVTFQPDHPSVNYSDRLTVELMNKSKVCVVDLRGAASSHNMYLLGGDPLMVPIESLVPSLIPSQPQLTESEVMEKSTIPVLVTLRAHYSAGGITPAVRELQVGCIRSTQASKKSGEFHWNDVASLQQLGFRVEPSGGTVETGHKRTTTVTWTPYSGYKPYEVVQTCVPLTLKGDERNVYRVTLMALVSTTAD
ncbi:cilia- and flagella-associated protein 74 isoform X4 [Sebastes umbrosus]|uniref:cilia- and flagella-associated protein 74 isoform X4 n=1 Tax=Sebastes umbrosus TaxID=72105 RepID=UPI00189CC475|nr:cilia- and flagella-associated protein 74 isoform X4 [Sebastes umbrosus]